MENVKQDVLKKWLGPIQIKVILHNMQDSIDVVVLHLITVSSAKTVAGGKGKVRCDWLFVFSWMREGRVFTRIRFTSFPTCLYRLLHFLGPAPHLVFKSLCFTILCCKKTRNASSEWSLGVTLAPFLIDSLKFRKF